MLSGVDPLLGVLTVPLMFGTAYVVFKKGGLRYASLAIAYIAYFAYFVFQAVDRFSLGSALLRAFCAVATIFVLGYITSVIYFKSGLFRR